MELHTQCQWCSSSELSRIHVFAHKMTEVTLISVLWLHELIMAMIYSFFKVKKKKNMPKNVPLYKKKLFISILPGTYHTCMWCYQVSRQVLHSSSFGNITPDTSIHCAHLHLKSTPTQENNMMYIFLDIDLHIWSCLFAYLYVVDSKRQ